MNYGFVIDNRKCIGCHACSTACKSENEVPLGVNRTWVKYTEKGTFPDTRRFFQVTRCNHCANPPCVTVCPVTAMYKRDDGIVEFNPETCIGCKACLQACPYDAVYIDPDSHTAAKCHFCAHRVDVGLEPACVVVCPEHAIIAGDLDDPLSEIARTLAAGHDVRVRKPEQNTKPKLFYIEAEETSIVPLAARQDDGMLWAQWPDQAESDWRGPIHIEDGRMAGALMRSDPAAARETYNAPHRIPWHWQVPAYLVTKAIGAGVFVVSAVGVAAGVFPPSALFTTIATLLSIVFIGITTGLLVWDLDRPERFLSIMTRPQWRSWLAKGAFVLVGFSALAGIIFLLQLSGNALARSPILIWPAVIGGILAAVYTAFLFAQCEGRDMWQSGEVPYHMFVQSILAGAAILLIAAPFAFVEPGDARMLAMLWATALLVNWVFIMFAEHVTRPKTAEHNAALRLLAQKRFAKWRWLQLLPGALAIATLVAGDAMGPFVWALAALTSLVALFQYEWGFVMAPQEVPNN